MKAKLSLLAIAITVTVPVWFMGAVVHAADPPRTRLAHIGLELDGAWGFIKQAAAEPDAELIAVADPHDDLLAKAKAALPAGIKFFADSEQMLDEMKPDAVLVTAPNNQHLAILRACARRHIHVWFQKPMASTLADAIEMERMAREAGITLMVNFWNLWLPDQQALSGRARAGELSTIQRVIVQNGIMASKKQSKFYADYFHDPVRHGGGALMDQGTYGICWALWLLGEPASVFATTNAVRVPREYAAEDESWVTLTWPGATAIIQGSWSLTDFGTGGAGEIQFSGTKGSLRRADGKVWFRPAVEGKGGDATVANEVETSQPPVERRNGIAHFLDCLRHHKPIEEPHSARFNVMVHRVTEAAYESARTGRAVKLTIK